MNRNNLNRILYAEDEADIRVIAEIALEDIGGFTVKYCSTGSEVLQAVKDFTPDLLILDVMMPVMDGPTALRELRKDPQFNRLPAIFMTAKIQPNEIDEYKNLGAIEIISKPFDPMLLAEQINRAWKKYYG